MALAQIIGIVVIFMIVFVIIYSVYSKNRRKKLLRKLAQEGHLPAPLENTLFFEGVAIGPKRKDLQGRPVAFHAIHIFKKKASVTRKVGLRSINGFELLEYSGDFVVQNIVDKNKYKIGLNDYYEQLLNFTRTYAQSAKVILTGENKNRQDTLAELEANNRAAESMMQVIFNYFSRKMESGFSVSVPLYEKNTSKIKRVKPLANIDVKVYDFIVGKNLPAVIESLIEERRAVNFLEEGDELFVIEFIIPIGQRVFVAGTYDLSTNSIEFRNSKIGLSVSYQNPAE